MKLVVLGLGYSAQAFVAQGRDRFSEVTATVRSAHKAGALSGPGLTVLPYAGGAPSGQLATAIREADAMLVSIPAEVGGDPVLRDLGAQIEAAPRLAQIIYLSTVGVYGDHEGAMVDETAALLATSQRGLNRIAAECGWMELGARTGKAVHIMRLAGIYGPGRNQLQALRAGTQRRIIKSGQMFSRIHVEDIAGACHAALESVLPGGVWNVADNEPAPPQDVIVFAADLLGIPPPPEEPFETAELSPMARSFYLDSRRISNARLTGVLGYRLRYPSFREGLTALWEAGEGRL